MNNGRPIAREGQVHFPATALALPGNATSPEKRPDPGICKTRFKSSFPQGTETMKYRIAIGLLLVPFLLGLGGCNYGDGQSALAEDSAVRSPTSAQTEQPDREFAANDKPSFAGKPSATASASIVLLPSEPGGSPESDDSTITTLFEPQHLKVAVLIDSLAKVIEQQLTGRKLRIAANEQSNGLIIVGTPKAHEFVLDVLKTADRLKGDGALHRDEAALATALVLVKAGRPRHFTLKRVNTGEVASLLRELLSPNPNHPLVVHAEPHSKQLCVSGSELLLDQVEAFLKQLDQPVAQPTAAQPSSANFGASEFQVARLGLKRSEQIVQKLFAASEANQGLKIRADEGRNLLMVTAPIETRERVGAVLKLLDRAVQVALAEQMDSDAVDFADPFAEVRLPIDRRQLVQDYRDLDRQAAGLAAELRDSKAAGTNVDNEHPDLVRLTTQLRTAVTQAFDARQRWQMAELTVLRSRLQRLEQGVKTRAQSKPQIIERRVQELLSAESRSDSEIQRADEPYPEASVIGNPSSVYSPPMGIYPPSSAAPPPLQRDSAATSVRKMLLEKLAAAEVELELERAQVQAQREALKRYVIAPADTDDEIARHVDSDYMVGTIRNNLRILRETLGNAEPEKRDDIQSQITSAEKKMTARKAEIIELERKNTIQAARIALSQAEAVLKNRERVSEILRQKLADSTDPSATEKPARKDQYRRAAAVWMTDVEAAEAKMMELKRPLLIYTDPPTQSLDLLAQKDWMHAPEVLDLLEKYFVAVRVIHDTNVSVKETDLLPQISIVGSDTKPLAYITGFRYDARFLDVLRKIAAEFDSASEERVSNPDSSRDPSGVAIGGAATTAVDEPGNAGRTRTQVRPNPYKFDAQGYTWLRGTVSRNPRGGGVVLRYSEDPQDDKKYGGKLRLVGDDRIEKLIEGEFLLVRGRIDPKMKVPTYIVESLSFLKPIDVSDDVVDPVLPDPVHNAPVADSNTDPRQKLIDAEAELAKAARRVNEADAAVVREVAQLESARKAAKANPLQPSFVADAERAVRAAIAEKESAEEFARTSERQLQLARENLAARIQLLELDLSDAVSRLEEAKESEAKTSRLIAKGYATTTEMDKNRRNVKRAELEVQRATIQLELYRKALPPKAQESSKAAPPKPVEPVSDSAGGGNPSETSPKSEASDGEDK
jgi:Bacterial type II/III secretion system short domain